MKNIYITGNHEFYSSKTLVKFIEDTNNIINKLFITNIKLFINLKDFDFHNIESNNNSLQNHVSDSLDYLDYDTHFKDSLKNIQPEFIKRNYLGSYIYIKKQKLYIHVPTGISFLDLFFKIIYIFDKECKYKKKYTRLNNFSLDIPWINFYPNSSFFYLIVKYFSALPKKTQINFQKKYFYLNYDSDKEYFSYYLIYCYIENLFKYDFLYISYQDFSNFNLPINQKTLLYSIRNDNSIILSKFNKKLKQFKFNDFDYNMIQIFNIIETFNDLFIKEDNGFNLIDNNNILLLLMIKSFFILERIPVSFIDYLGIKEMFFINENGLTIKPYFFDLEGSLLTKINDIIIKKNALNYENISLKYEMSDLSKDVSESTINDDFLIQSSVSNSSKRILKNKKNTSFILDSKDSEMLLKNNCIIYGNSGTGKTFFINDILSSNKKITYFNVNSHADIFELKLSIIESIFTYISSIFYEVFEVFEDQFKISDNILSYNKNIFEVRIFIDEFNRGNSINNLTNFLYILDVNKHGFSDYKYINVLDCKDRINQMLSKFLLPLKNKYSKYINFYKDGSGKSPYLRILNYARLFLEKDCNISPHFHLFENFLNGKDNEINNLPLFSTPNLKFILSMNTVDFNVEQIDLMFNRRFIFLYKPYNILQQNIKLNYWIFTGNNSDKILWISIQNILNNIIVKHFHESKCIGYYFWNNTDISFNIFKDKILFYLYYNVLSNSSSLSFKFDLKDNKSHLFFDSNKTFEELNLAKNFNELFCNNIIQQLLENKSELNNLNNIEKNKMLKFSTKKGDTNAN